MNHEKLRAILSYAKDFQSHGEVLRNMAEKYRTQHDLGNQIAGIGSSMEVRQHEHELRKLEKDLLIQYQHLAHIFSYIENFPDRTDFEDELVAVLVHRWNEADPSDTTVEVTQSDGAWSFYHKGKLSDEFSSLKKAVKFIKDNEY